MMFTQIFDAKKTLINKCPDARLGMLRWIRWLFIVLSLVPSFGAHAAVESVPLTFVFHDYTSGFTTTVSSFDAASCREALMRQYSTGIFSPGFFDLWHYSISPDGHCGYQGGNGSIGVIEWVCAFQGSWIPWKYNLVNKTCDRLAPDNFTLSLSGGITTEPWHKKRDPNHLNANLTYQAIVKDQNGQPKANVSVTINTYVTPGSGGHAHDNNRPKGWLAETPAKITAQIQTGASQGSGTLSGITDSSGTFAFTFGAEEASGEHTLTATCIGCSTTASATVNVLIPGLTQLDANPLSYTLTGDTPEHPGNHYFSSAALVQIINLAFAYSHDPAFNNQFLIINDSSLIKGGVFDLGKNWTYKPNGHQGHRKGVVVDINNYRNRPSPQFERFALDQLGITAKWEGPDVTDTPHYHLWLLGRDE